MKLIRNNKGMSFIEIMVTGAMTLIISMGIVFMMQNSFKEQKRIIVFEIEGILTIG